MKNKINSSGCIVAFVDLLGFSEFVNNNNIETVSEIFNKILSFGERIQNDKIIDFVSKDEEDAYNQFSDHVYFKIMSDSIVLASDIVSKESLLFLVKWISNIQAYLLQCNTKITVRGGISESEFYGDEFKMFGKGMVLAYQLENKQAKVARVIIDEFLLRKIWGNEDYKSEFSLETSEIKIDNDGLAYIDYFQQVDWVMQKADISKYVDESIKKADNLKKKYEWIKEKMDHQLDILDMMIESEEFRCSTFD